MAGTESTPNRDKLVGLVLAAGLSRRLGQVKPQLPWGKGTLLDHTLDLLERVALPAVIVWREDLPRPAVPHVVTNPHSDRGLASSLQVGIDYLSREFPGQSAAIFLVDQPFLTVSQIITVIQEFQRREDTIHGLRPLYDGMPGHPVLIDTVLFPEVYRLTGDEGLGAFFRHRADCRFFSLAVPKQRPHPSFDIDTPNDYRRALVWKQEIAKEDGQKYEDNLGF